MEKYKIYNIDDVGKEVVINGWVSRVRNLGGLVFIDLRNRMGIIQVVVKPDNKYYDLANSLKSEYVIKVFGIIVERESKNKNLLTGDIEINLNKLELVNVSKEIPFVILDDTTALEDTRLKYRYLDLRRESLRNNLVIRNNITFSIRKFLNNLDFLEIETPILCKSTPEGARDYLVPSRINKGSFYALPQSPQLYKQLLMVGGMERYFQIAKCFRDEDLRSDRQPEFTQVDVEMSFVDEDMVMELGEKMVANVFKDVLNMDIKLPLMRMKYDDAINLYGSDKPDLRFDMKLHDISNIFKNTEFSVFKNVLEENGIINALVVKDKADSFSRKDIDKLTDFVKGFGASGLAYLKFNEEVTGSIVKVISDEELNNVKKELDINNNDLVLIVSGKKKIVKSSLGATRSKLGKELGLINPDDYKLLWVTDFPSFEWSDEENRFMAMHHPFTSPKDSDVDKLLTDKEHCYSKAYDIVINGYEAGGGSIRIHDGEVQKKMFEALELTDEDVKEKFGWFNEALQYGCPPHGGFALGLDRLTMLLAKTENIRDVIAFPKTNKATDMMCNCPSEVDKNQLEELGIKVKEGLDDNN